MTRVTRRRRFVRVRQPPSGNWQARYPDGAGGLVMAPTTFSTKALAERYLAGGETDQSRGDWTDPRLGRRLFFDFADEWWRTTKGSLRPSTQARDEGYVNRYILPRFADHELAEVTHLEVRGWVADLSSGGLAPATVVKAYQLLSKILAAAVDGRLLAASPYPRVPLLRIERFEMRYLSADHVAALAEAIDPRYRALILVAGYAGLRVGELAGLKRSRVDLLHRTIDVVEVCVEASGRLNVGPPKTRAGRRIVPIPPQVASELEQHLARWSGDELVFTAPEGGPLRVARGGGASSIPPSQRPAWPICGRMISATPRWPSSFRERSESQANCSDGRRRVSELHPRSLRAPVSRR